MSLRQRLTAALDRLRAAWQIDNATVFSAVIIDYEGQRYRAEAHARYVLLERVNSGRARHFDTDHGAEHYKLAREVFDGFEWNLTTLMAMIDIYEGRNHGG